MSQITGKAKKFDGTAVDYVSIFNWSDGKCVSQVTPNASGVWVYDYDANLHCGITYIADGCAPITHGPYTFNHVEPVALSGYLALSVSRSSYFARQDVNAVSEPTWVTYWSKTKDIALISYNYSGKSPTSTPWQKKIIDGFRLGWVLKLSAYSYLAAGDSHQMTIEILDANNNVLLAIKSGKASELKGEMRYGYNLGELIKAGASGAGITDGTLTFSQDGVVYQNLRTDGNGITSFSFAANLKNAAKVAIGASSLLANGSSGSAGVIVELL